MLSKISSTFLRIVKPTNDRIVSLPIVVLMPHSACNCRCVMCDIWKNNINKYELDTDRIGKIVNDLKKLRTRLVVLSGGEALLHPKIFDFCTIIRNARIKISLLSTGLLLERFCNQIITHTDDVIISLDGSETVHNLIRRIPDAFLKLKTGVQSIKQLKPHFRITGRCVIQKKNFRDIENIIVSAKNMGLDQISFLAADTFTSAFNHDTTRLHINEITIDKNELPEFHQILKDLFVKFKIDFQSKFIVESPSKMMHIYHHYAAANDIGNFEAPRCNAPWVSAVIEADGNVRPCFFHTSYDTLSSGTIESIINAPQAVQFRKNLDVKKNDICRHCVCSLYFKHRLF
ncbi:radical SAM protein [bacterium]|nr:radical SAM protein [bacterium]